ncbi:MAG: hypothetical protein CVU56_10885 [Deltaproteobacteria bacterium HGW-Deltaproteobacteria-14]|jgi:hypothetical protein|nr:MAG: hypothetical protein CVU56_10885 [Deltaproteobacteria bacterium HGW-Deltaproteobacteria-14]
MTLTAPGPLRLRELVAFDLRHGLPVVWRVLRERLGRGAAARVVARYAAANLGPDPLRGLRLHADPREPLARYQLRSALRLERALAGLPRPLAAELLNEVVAEVGAAFVAALAALDAAAWAGASDDERRAYARGLLGRFPNSTGEVVAVSPTGLDFDITACRFVALTRELGRPDLTPLFCAADTRYYARAGTPSLRRDETLAAGDARCAFRIRYGPDGGG